MATTSERPKVYTNIISAWVKQDISPEEFEALQLVLESFQRNRLDLYTSHVVGEELDKLPAEHRRMHRLVYEFIRRVPRAEETRLDYGLLMGMDVGGGRIQDPIFRQLLALLDEPDARHVFQAIRNGATTFLTVDGGIRRRAKDLEIYRLRVAAPTELIAELDRSEGR